MELEQVVLGDNAINQVLSIIEQEQQEDPSIAELFLKISVKGGGCSGFQYKFDLTEMQAENEYLFVATAKTGQQVSLVVDHFSFLYLKGATVDFKEDAMGARFVIDNPNAATTCSCGDSFSVDD